MRAGKLSASLVGCILWAAPAVGQAPPPGPQDPTPSDAARLYAGACASCHGRAGDGRGPAARGIGSPQPRDLTSGVYKYRSTPTGSLPTDEDIYRTISRGIPGTWMPAWDSHLSSAERWALVRYVKGFSEYFAEEEPDPAIEIPPEPAPTPELVREGHWVFVVLKCWQCHGRLGRGDGPSADELTDDWDRRIRPYDFTRGDYKNGSSPSDLYRTIVTGLNGSPMPAFEPDIVAFPGGANEDIEPMREVLEDDEASQLAAYLATQPAESALRTMSQPEFDALVERRMWALIYYLRSLERGKGLLYWLFGENPELASGN